MNRQLKAELYKMKHSSILMVSFIGILFIVALSFLFGEMNFFSAGDGTITYIGFQAKSYVSENGPLFEEVVRSSLAYTAFFWCIALIVTVVFFQNEYSLGTIKLSISYGIPKWIIYLTKILTIFITIFFLYFLFIGIFLIIELMQSGYKLNFGDFLRITELFLLNYCTIIGFLSLIIFLSSVLYNVGIVVCIGCIYVFTGMSIYLMLWNSMQSISNGLRLFIYCNPMYYWMNFSSCKTQGILENIWIFLLFNILLLILGGIINNRKEIK